MANAVNSNLRKIKILLDALERSRKTVSYFALDLMYTELERTLALVPEGTFNYVKCAGLWGTYDDGLAWLKQGENANRPKAILSMGGCLPRVALAMAYSWLCRAPALATLKQMMQLAFLHNLRQN